jgi:hypothetical protein
MFNLIKRNTHYTLFKNGKTLDTDNTRWSDGNVLASKIQQRKEYILNRMNKCTEKHRDKYDDKPGDQAVLIKMQQELYTNLNSNESYRCMNLNSQYWLITILTT